MILTRLFGVMYGPGTTTEGLMRTPTTSLLKSAAFALALATLLGACASAESTLKEGLTLARAGSHDQALASFERISTKWPAAEEAAAAGALSGAVVAAKNFGDGDYRGARMIFGTINPLSPAEPTVGQQAGLDLVGELVGPVELFDLGVSYQEAVEEGPTDAGLALMLGKVIENDSVHDDKGIRQEGRSWACENVEDFPAYGSCENADSDLSGIDIAAVRARLSDAEASCLMMQRLSAACGQDLASEVAAMTAEGSRLSALRVSAAVQEADFRVAAQADLADGRRKMLGDGQFCETEKEETIAMIHRAFSFKTVEDLEKMWARTEPGSDGGISEFKAIMVMGFENTERTMKSNLYSDSCNAALTAGYRRLRRGCLRQGTPADLDWIDGVGREECP